MLFLPREEGQGLVEYALILVLVAIVVILVLTFLGEQVTNVFQNIADALS
jgi:pilus assembly protein Flp/PilA